jgi:GT2 family glycosyltransferase
MSRLSVIIPVRNDPTRLAKCLDALANSTFKDFEVIVADDASSDDTPGVAQAKHARLVRLARRSGAAAARNAGAELAGGEILLFVDADVCVHPDTLDRAVRAFDDQSVHAVFGSYDLEPAEPNLLSQYKNLAHRFYHQNANGDVRTFWTGCGAIRRQDFNAFRFDDEQFKRPSIEDIELGARLSAAGRRIVIRPDMQATHLKRWSLLGIIRSDVLDRAIPWTRVIHRQPGFCGDLNLALGQRIAALLSALSVAIWIAACWFRPWLAALPVVTFGLLWLADTLTSRRRAPAPTVVRAGIAALLAALAAATIWYGRWWTLAIFLPLAAVVLINARFYRFFVGHRGWLFAIGVALPMHVLYYIYSIAGYGVGTLLHWCEAFPRRLDDARFRARLYIGLAIALYVLSWALVIVRAQVKDTTIDFAVSDAIGYYAYLPSVVIDRDLKFDNQLAAQKQFDSYYMRAMSRNRWPIGVALSLAPAFVMAHGAALVVHPLTGAAAFEPHGYSVVYFVFCVACAMAIGTVALILLDRLLIERLHVPGSTAAAAVLVTWFGTNYLWYFAREPLMAHQLGASWVIFCIYLIHRMQSNAREGRLVWWHPALLVFTASMAAVCRMTNAILLLPAFIYMLVILLRFGPIGRAVKLAPLVLPALAPVLLQVIIMKLLLGTSSYENVHDLGYDKRERFYWTDPALFRSLFSSRHGLFFSTPLLLLSLWGLVWYMARRGKRRDVLVACLAFSALPLWYVNSAWYAWWFGPSAGNRGFVELAGLYAIGFALAFVWMSRLRPTARRVVLAAIVLGFIVNYAIMGVKLFDIVGEHNSLIPWEDRIFIGRWERI